MSRRAAVNEKQGRHSSHFALVRFAMMTTCLDLAAELLSALIAGHEERAEVREERRGAGGHVKALGVRRIGARDALALATLVTRTYSRSQFACAITTACPKAFSEVGRAARGAGRAGQEL